MWAHQTDQTCFSINLPNQGLKASSDFIGIQPLFGTLEQFLPQFVFIRVFGTTAVQTNGPQTVLRGWFLFSFPKAAWSFVWRKNVIWPAAVSTVSIHTNPQRHIVWLPCETQPKQHESKFEIKHINVNPLSHGPFRRKGHRYVRLR